MPVERETIILGASCHGPIVVCQRPVQDRCLRTTISKQVNDETRLNTCHLMSREEVQLMCD